MSLELVIKNKANNEYLKYSIEDFCNDFVKEIQENKPLSWSLWSKEKQRYWYFKTAEKLILEFKKKTKYLPPDAS